MTTHTEGEWRLGEENVGGGYNIYAGPLPVARTSILSAVNATRFSQRALGEEEAKANAATIVEAVNAVRVLKDPVAVHANMLRGGIAIPNLRDLLHLHGPEALARWDAFVPLLQALKAVNEELRLIRMKDTAAVYDPYCRIMADAAIASAEIATLDE